MSQNQPREGALSFTREDMKKQEGDEGNCVSSDIAKQKEGLQVPREGKLTLSEAKENGIKVMEKHENDMREYLSGDEPVQPHPNREVGAIDPQYYAIKHVVKNVLQSEIAGEVFYESRLNEEKLGRCLINAEERLIEDVRTLISEAEARAREEAEKDMLETIDTAVFDNQIVDWKGLRYILSAPSKE